MQGRLIRKKAKTIHKYIETGKYIGTYDRRGFNEYIKYVDGLFVRYSKLLVIRLDLEYRDEYTTSVTFEEAQDDISRFIKNRRWNSIFEHCAGYIIAKEIGRQGRGFHFHCFIFFDGQNKKRSMILGKRIGKDYWEDSITRLPDLNDQKRSRGAYFNCNIKENKYRYSGIGMIDHADEIKRANLIYALVYLFKENEQVLGEDAPPKTHTITRGVLPPLPEKRPGPARRVFICGEKVMVPKA